jgi:hypothetical protein
MLVALVYDRPRSLVRGFGRFGQTHGRLTPTTTLYLVVFFVLNLFYALQRSSNFLVVAIPF